MDLIWNIIGWLLLIFKYFIWLFLFLSIALIAKKGIKDFIQFIIKKYNDRNSNIIIKISKNLGGYDLLIKNSGKNCAEDIEIKDIKVLGPNMWIPEENYLYFEQLKSGDTIFKKSVINSDYMFIPPDNQLGVKLELSWKDKNNNKNFKKEEKIRV